MASFATFGNDLYTGRRQFDFIGKRKRWYALTAVLLVLAAVGLFGRGLNFGLGFVVGLRLGKEGVGGGLALVHLPLRRVQIHHHAFVGATYIHADIVDGDPDAVLVRWELVIVGGQQAV